jgi:hypothetical protein
LKKKINLTTGLERTRTRKRKSFSFFFLSFLENQTEQVGFKIDGFYYVQFSEVVEKEKKKL